MSEHLARYPARIVAVATIAFHVGCSGTPDGHQMPGVASAPQEGRADAYTRAGINSPTRGPQYGRTWLEDYVANRYHKPSDEYDPGWDVGGIIEDLAVYYDVGLALANPTSWPNWRTTSEFRTTRDRSRATATN